MADTQHPDDTARPTAAQAADELNVRPLDDQSGDAASDQIDDRKSAPEDRAENGPYDVSEVPAMRPYIDMGGLKIAPREGLKVRLDVEEKQKRIVAVTLEYRESTLQVQAFSAPKTTGLWNEVRAQIQQNLSAQGATVSSAEGPLGPELRITPPAQAQGQPVRFVGVDGPRWMLRGVIVGAGARDPEAASAIEAVFREVVVVRGEHPMPPSELLPLKVPACLQQGTAGDASSVPPAATENA